MSALAAGRLGVWPLVCTVLAAAAPLTVVAGGATAGFAVTGITGIPLGYLVVAAVLAVFSLGYVAMAERVVHAGAFYTFVTHGLGRPAGVAAAFVAVLAYNVMQIGLYGGFGVVLAGFAAAETGLDLPWWAWALLGWALVAGLGSRRVDLNGRVLAVLLVAEIAVALVLAVVQVAHPEGGTVSFATLSPAQLGVGALGAVFATAVAGFVGFEGTAVFGEEARDPRRTVARATFIAPAVIGVLYAFCAWAMSVAAGPAHIVARATAESSELIFNLSAPYLPSSVLTLGHLLFISSLFAALLAFHNTAARYFFAFGRDGVLPAALGRTSPATRAPIAGSLLQTALALIVIILYAVTGWHPFTRMFFWLTVLGGVGVLILMTGTSLAVAAYFTRTGNRDGLGPGQAVAAPILAVLLLGAGLVATVSQFDVLIGVAPDDPVRWQLPGLFAVAAGVGCGWALFLRARRPQVYAALGRAPRRTTVAG
jgi:amino acid transporter